VAHRRRGVVVQRLPDDSRSQAAVVSLAGQHAHQPAGGRHAVEASHGSHLAVDQPTRGLPLVVVADGLHRLGGDVVVDALRAKLRAERPAGQPTPGLA
jgi:hypothetical protein